MADLSNMSDEDLLDKIGQFAKQQPQFAQTQQGQTPQISDLSSMSDEELMHKLSSTKQNVFTKQFGDYQANPVNVVDRLRLSFADDEGREKFLSEKFQFVKRLDNGKFVVGDSLDTLAPVDPEGLFNDVVGDIADVVGEIPIIAGQMLGAGIGGAAGAAAGGVGAVPGAIAGGAIGSGLGTAAKIGAGKILGVQQGKAIADATDIAMNTLFGAAGEGLVAGTQVLGKAGRAVIAPKLARLLDRGAKSQNGGMLKRGVGKLFSILANVPEESTETVFKHGVEKTLGNPFNLSKKSVVELSSKMQKSLAEGRNIFGKEVGAAVDRLVGKTANKIPLDDMYKTFRKDLINLGMLDNVGNVKKNFTGKENITTARKILSELAGSRTTLKSFKDVAENSVPLKNLISLRSMFSDAFSNATPEYKRVLTRLIDGASDTGSLGIKGTISDIANKLGSEDLIRANKNFSEFMTILDEFKFSKKNDLNSMEKFIKGLERLGENQKNSLQNLDNALPDNLKFLDSIEMWNAAQDFTKAKPDILRMSAIGSLLGISTGFDDKQSKIATIGGALLLGTPAGTRAIFRTGAASGRALTPKALPVIGNKGASKVAAATLSRLLENDKKQIAQRQK